MNLRLPPDTTIDSAAKAEMKADLRSCLEQIIHGFSYPKQILNFQVTVMT
jgi:hypothetical protein